MSTQPIDAARYTYRVTWSSEEQGFLATCLELPALSALAESPEDALADLRTQVATHVEYAEANGDACPEPIATRSYSGTLTLSIGAALHRKLAEEAAEEGTSLPQHAIRKLSANL